MHGFYPRTRLASAPGAPENDGMQHPALNGLNPPQRQAVLHTEGPLLVLAGAGSGKTRVIIEKIAHLIHSGRYPAKRIAAITFTNKSAREMRERVAKRIRGDAAQELTVSTFHALGLRILQIDHAKLGLRRGFSIFDADDSASQVKDLLGPGTKPDAIDAMKQLISRAKNAGLSPEQAAAAALTGREREAAALYARYQQRLAAFNAVDFDDLIRLPVQLLETDADAVAGWRERIGYLLVDECQDTNDAQYRLLKAIAGDAGQFTCVGDDDQSIYAWRGANPDNLLALGTDYPALKIVKLEQNYRCSNRVLRAANAVIANNPHEHPKTLWSDAADGERIRVWECRDAAHEADKVAGEIQFVAQKHTPPNGVPPWSEFCILFRGNHQSRALEKSLQLLRIPYHLSGGTAFLDRAEVKDALAWLRLLANPDDDAAFLRAVQSPNRGVGATSLERLGELANHAHLPMSVRGRIHDHCPGQAVAGACGECAAGVFRHRPNGLRIDARTLPPAELVRKLNSNARACSTRCASAVQGRGAASRRAQVATWTNWPTGSTGRKDLGSGRTRGCTGPAVACRQGRSGQFRAPDDPAFGQGPGVPLRVHHRRGRRQPSRTRPASKKAASMKNAA
jgi:ATP-dependent DNA helicase Rep